jgi:hypothetical protein
MREEPRKKNVKEEAHRVKVTEVDNEEYVEFVGVSVDAVNEAVEALCVGGVGSVPELMSLDNEEIEAMDDDIVSLLYVCHSGNAIILTRYPGILTLSGQSSRLWTSS